MTSYAIASACSSAGRAAEQLVCTDISTGAEDDLAKATELARQMVCRFGMSEKLGPLTFERTPTTRFLFGEGEDRGYSEATAQTIDEEVRELVTTELARARKLLGDQRPALSRITGELITKETLTGEDLKRLLAEPVSATTPTAGPSPDVRRLTA